MVAILTYMLAFLGVLWFADELLTILDVKKVGINREENPLIRWLIRHGDFWLTSFKVFTFAVLVALILFVNSIHQTFAIILTGVLSAMYLFIVVRNFEIYEGWA